MGESLSTSSYWLTINVVLDENCDYSLTFPEYFYVLDTYGNYLYIRKLKTYDIVDTTDMEQEQINSYSYKDIRTKKGGFVIYQTDSVDNLTDQQMAKKTYNQWVWVPMTKSELSSLTYKSQNKIKTLTSYFTVSSFRSYSAYDRYLVTADINKSYITKYLNYETKSDFVRNSNNELSDMVNFIKLYGGFFISRYELSDVYSNSPKSVSNVLPTDGMSWYEAKSTIENMVVETQARSTIVYGFQWDHALNWLVKSGEKRCYDMVQSDGWGAFHGVTFTYTNSSGVEITRANNIYSPYSSQTIIPTGSSEYTNANNIYDLAGNLAEWSDSRSSESSKRVVGRDHAIASAAIRRCGSYSYASFYYGDAPYRSGMWLGARAVLYV